MSDHYTPAGSSTTVRVLSSTQVIDVQAVAIYTKPSQVYVVVQVPLADFEAGNSATYLNDTADFIEGLLAANPDAGQQLVTSVNYVSDTDQSGLLAGFLAFTVSYTPQGKISAPFEATVTLPVTAFETAEAFNSPVDGYANPVVAITDTYARLKALAES